MRKAIIAIFVLPFILSACPSENTQESYESDVKKTTDHVKNKLNEIDQKAQQKTEEVAETIKEKSQEVGAKVDKGMQNIENKTKETFGD